MVVSSQLTSVLNDLGWGSGFRLPVANEENRALETLLEQKQKRLLELDSAVEVDTNHVGILESHLGRIEIAIKETQKMVNAKRNGMESETTLKDLSEKMYSKYKSDLQAARQEALDYTERNLRMSEDIDARRRVIEDLVNTVKFDQVALQRFKQVTEDKESYINFLNTLTTVDERVGEDYQLKFRKIGEDLHNSRRKLNDSVTNTTSLQQQFNRLSEQFRRVHGERSQALQLWEGTLQVMRQRDDNIRNIAEEYADFRCRLQEAESKCERRLDMLNQEQRNNRDVEYQLNTSDRNVTALNSRISEVTGFHKELHSEINSLNQEITNTSTKLKEVEAQIAELDKAIAESEHKLQEMELELVDTQLRHKAAKGDAMNEDKRTTEIENMIDKETQNQEKILREIEKFRRLLWAKSNEKTELESELKTTTAEIKTAKIMIQNLKEKYKNDDLIAQKAKQQVYRLELDVIHLETKIQHMLDPAEPSPSDNVSMEELAKLREQHTEISKTKHFLQTQESHLISMIKKVRTEMDQITREYSELQLETDTQAMETRRSTLENKKLCEEVQSLQLDTKLLQVTLKRCQKLATEERALVHSLEQDRLLMETAAKERKAEIEVHMGMLKQQHKLLKEETSKLKTYIGEVWREICVSKKNYEHIFNTMTDSETPGPQGTNEVQSEAYAILKHAQQREMLKQEGDEWDAKVKEAEKEIAALQNTLSVLVSANMAFKESLAPAPPETPEAKLMEELEEEHKITFLRKRKAEKRLAELQQLFEEEGLKLEALQHALKKHEDFLGERTYDMSNIHFEIANQKEKIIRANKMANRLIKELCLHMHDKRDIIELDLKLRCVKDKLEYAIKTLEKMLLTHPDLREPALQLVESSEELQTFLPRLKKKLETSPSLDRSGMNTPISICSPSVTSSRTNLEFAPNACPPNCIPRVPMEPKPKRERSMSACASLAPPTCSRTSTAVCSRSSRSITAASCISSEQILTCPMSDEKICSADSVQEQRMRRAISEDQARLQSKEKVSTISSSRNRVVAEKPGQ